MLDRTCSASRRKNCYRERYVWKFAAERNLIRRASNSDLGSCGKGKRETNGIGPCGKEVDCHRRYKRNRESRRVTRAQQWWQRRAGRSPRGQDKGGGP